MKFLLKLLAITLCVLFVFGNVSLFEIGGTYNQEQSQNYNGYFAIVDEDELISLGFTYYTSFSPAYAEHVVNECYYRLYTYGDTISNGVILLSKPYVVYTMTRSNTNAYTSASMTFQADRFGWLSGRVYYAGTSILLDSTTNYSIYVLILGVSNYE